MWLYHIARDFHGNTKFSDFRKDFLINVDFSADSNDIKISLVGQNYGRQA